MAMIFTPCRGGYHHNNREEAIVLHPSGVNVLLHAVLALAMR
jgi:hypothetical protein